MRRWLGSWFRRSSLWRLVVLLVVLAALLFLAELHAWACTGGRPEWREVSESPAAERSSSPFS